ncbi:hypothetical protein [Streptomyces bambusae]|uniref:Uncharacterized protein n=1 Tax=Streptomyces bambusae TaxID=1550616 RepID=A0ABS6Z0V3_9ACTN|nr:hypothetical protein [Streptomyces bambusae]MBW5480873.1 hypothetical protein [Streptomyces bambusae]
MAISAATESEDRWRRLSAETLREVSKADRAQLEAERLRAGPAIRSRIVTPAHSLKNRFLSWERLIGFLEGKRPPNDQYLFSEFENDLDHRDALEGALSRMPEGPRRELSSLLGSLDARFDACTAEDVTGELDPWLRRRRRDADPAHWWWHRKPNAAPW